MKLFLAPLYFIKSFCKHCISMYYSEHPDEWVWQHELRSMPPLGFYESGTGFIPDFSLLTMFDEFTISGEAYDHILSQSAPDWLGTWPEITQLLESEGALTTVDIDSELNTVSHKRGWMLRRDMEDPTIWSDAMAYHDALMASANEAYSKSPKDARTPNWRFDVESIPGVLGSDDQTHMLSASPLIDPGDDPDHPHHQLHEVALNAVSMQLREINAGIALSMKLNAAPMYWAPYRQYLAKKSEISSEVTSIEENAGAARLFFDVAFPRYSPSTVDHLSRLRSDPRITQLRSEIRNAAETGDLMDPSYPQRVLEEAFHLERRLGKIRQIAGWISSAIGLIPVPGVGIAASAVSEIVGSAVEKSIKKDLRWLYLISDGTGHT